MNTKSTPQAIAATPRLLIRPFVLDDAPVVNARLDSDPRQMQFTGSVKTLEETREALLRQIEWTQNHPHGCGKWAVVLRADNSIVGWCALVPLPGRPEDIEVGYIISPLFWGQGFATEAAAALVEYAFRELRRPAVYSMVNPQNHPSVRVTQKLGMNKVGQITCATGQKCDLYCIRSGITAAEKIGPQRVADQEPLASQSQPSIVDLE
jgi:RimJ/RimL family protein N-acetyltransferase